MPTKMHQEHCGQPLSPLGPQVPESCPREAAVQFLGHHLSTDISQADAGHLSLQRRLPHTASGGGTSRPVSRVSEQCSTTCARGRDPERHQGCAHTQIPSDQCSPRLGSLGEGSTQKRWSPPLGYTCVRLYTETIMATVPPALTLKP